MTGKEAPTHVFIEARADRAAPIPAYAVNTEAAYAPAYEPAISAPTPVLPAPTLPAPAPAPVLDEPAEPQNAQAAAPVAPTIGAVSLMGADQLGYASMSQAFAPYLGQAADPLTLQTLTRSLADEARSRGYPFATAQVPDQAMVMGVVRVQLDLGRIDEVRIIGSSNKRLAALLNKLAGSAPRTADLERQLLLAGDLPGVVILGNRYDREHGLGVLEVRVAERKADASISADSFGPRAYGPVRARASADIYNVGPDGSRLNVQMTRALDNDELTYGAVRYSATVLEGAGVVGVTASMASTEPGKPVTYPLNGESVYASAYGSVNLLRTRKASAWLNGEVAYLGIDQQVAGTTITRDRTLTISASLSGNHTVGDGRVSGEIGMTQGVLPADKLGSAGLPAPRPEGKSKFTKVTAWVSYFIPFKHRTQARVTAAAQVAPKPLPNSQEMSLGGPSYGRAFDFSERFGDQGVALSVELSHDLKVPKTAFGKVQLYGFADAAKVSEHGTLQLGEGELVSAGAGLRLQKGRFDMSLEAAFPLNTDRFYTGDRTPRLNAQARWKF